MFFSAEVPELFAGLWYVQGCVMYAGANNKAQKHLCKPSLTKINCN